MDKTDQDNELHSEPVQADPPSPVEGEAPAEAPIHPTNARLNALNSRTGSHSEQFCNPALIASHQMFEPLDEAELSSHWSVPWSDLMMVMFVMFALMFAMQMAEQDIQKMFVEDAHPPDDLEKQAEVLRKEQPKPEPVPEPYPEPEPEIRQETLSPDGVSPQQILQESQRIIAEAQLENIDVVLTSNRAVEVSVRGPLLFDLGKADLKPAAARFLNQLATIIARNNYLIEVVGHTDNFPISTAAYPTNWELSAARAARVARHMIKKGRLDPARFTIIGQSMYRPSVPQTSLANKAKNRRVAIIITSREYKP